MGYVPPQVSGTEGDMLTGPPMPGEGGGPYSGMPSVPSGAEHWLPALQTAASTPGAPPQFQNMLKLVVANLQATAQG